MFKVHKIDGRKVINDFISLSMVQILRFKYYIFVFLLCKRLSNFMKHFYINREHSISTQAIKTPVCKFKFMQICGGRKTAVKSAVTAKQKICFVLFSSNFWSFLIQLWILAMSLCTKLRLNLGSLLMLSWYWQVKSGFGIFIISSYLGHLLLRSFFLLQ